MTTSSDCQTTSGQVSVATAETAPLAFSSATRRGRGARGKQHHQQFALDRQPQPDDDSLTSSSTGLT